MSQPPLRGAVIGCGMIAEFHLRAWNRLPQVEIVALCDPDRDAAEARRVALAPRAAVHQNFAALLATETLDFVDILTPPALHAEHVLQAAAAGLHIICQKPLTVELAEGRGLVRALKTYPRVFAIHENHPYRPWFRAVLDHARAGTFGKLRLLRLEQLDPYEPAQAFKAEASRGVMYEYGTHLVDMMRALLGEPRRVYARMHRQNPRVRGDSVAHVIYEYDDASTVIDIAWKNGGVQQGSFLLVGDEGEAFFDGRMTRGSDARLRVLRGRDVVLDEQRVPTQEFEDAFFLFQTEAVQAMLGRGPTPQPAAWNLRTLACSLAAYEAADAGQSVPIQGIESDG